MAVVGLVALFAAVVWGGINLVAAGDRRSCNASTADMAIPHQWGFWSGCRVKDPRLGWVPLANYRVF